MNELKLQRDLIRRTRELTVWQAGALGLLLLSSMCNAAYAAALLDAREQLREQTAQLQQAEDIRDMAVRELKEMILRAEQEARTEPEDYEALGTYTYIGECVITAYCPCELCCGEWADGLTATGLPAVPGIVAVDPDVIPMGSTVVIGGRRYLAADTGGAVRGLRVDVCLSSHQEAEKFGVQNETVWVMEGGEQDD